MENGAFSDLGEGVEPQFSPDGTWMVHNSAEGILARPVHRQGPRLQIASYGAAQPRWSRDGRRIFYITPDRDLMSVEIDVKKQVVSAPGLVASTGIIGAAFVGFQYDEAPGGRFLVNRLQSAAPPLTLVTGWSAALGER